MTKRKMFLLKDMENVINVQLKIHFTFYFYMNHICLFSVSSAKLLLTDLGKKSTDDALDQDQCPGESELLLLVSLTIITSSAGKFTETTLCWMQHITNNECKIEVSFISFLGNWLKIGVLLWVSKLWKGPSETISHSALNYSMTVWGGGILLDDQSCLAAV